jgi:hypothetical protein
VQRCPRPFGKFFERTDLPTLYAAYPILNASTLVHADPRVPPLMARSLIEELM